eukprot:TRINITY_DN5314_c0_g3_i1.p1 TRINITY_DN5314_c0_g3~~TRINITY_DN5314_c0_g3_i1.p1  ORF type:complete len:489 (+),score=117.75 TRINITY_DN5314_c0_g3_i1:23-1468(+)
MIRRPPRSTHCISSAASDVYKRQKPLSEENFECTVVSRYTCTNTYMTHYINIYTVSKMLKIAGFYVLFLLLFVNSKVVYKNLSFKKGKQWQYITKFGISIGRGAFEIKARFKKPFNTLASTPRQQVFTFTTNFYLDSKWYAAMEELDCSAKAEHKIRAETISINANGEWSEVKRGYLKQHTRPYVWFLAADDCNSSMHLKHPTMPPVQIYIKFTGEDDTEFSHEEIGLLGLYSISLIVYTLILGYNVYSYYKNVKKTERADNPILILLIAVGLEFLSILFMWTHLLVYSKDGEGLGVCHVIAVVAEVGSQFFLSVLLILISWGWTINYLEFADLEIYIALLVMLLLLHLLVAGMTQLTSDAYHKYDDYEGVQGIILVVFRLGMFAYFLYGMRDTYRVSRPKAKLFLKPFAISAGLYLISFPLLVLTCQVFAHYVRHKVMVIGSIVVQSVALCTLLQLFIGKTAYTKVSKNFEPILPSGKAD